MSGTRVDGEERTTSSGTSLMSGKSHRSCHSHDPLSHHPPSPYSTAAALFQLPHPHSHMNTFSLLRTCDLAASRMLNFPVETRSREGERKKMKNKRKLSSQDIRKEVSGEWVTDRVCIDNKSRAICRACCRTDVVTLPSVYVSSIPSDDSQREFDTQQSRAVSQERRGRELEFVGVWFLWSD